MVKNCSSYTISLCHITNYKFIYWWPFLYELSVLQASAAPIVR